MKFQTVNFFKISTKKGKSLQYLKTQFFLKIVEIFEILYKK